MSVALSARNLSVAYSAACGKTLAALGPVSFHIEPGTFVSLVGPSGSGKSTLIRVLAGLQAAESGAAFIDGTAISGPSRRVAMMFQDANLMPWRTVVDNVALPLELAGVNAGQRREAARELLPRLGLAEFADAYPGELSGGMAQRTALGRVLIQQPDVLLLDEPLGALDAMTREQVSSDLLRLWSLHKPTVVMVTHDVNEAVRMSDRVLVLSRRPGRIVADVAVTLPRPRTQADTYQAAFGVVAEQIRSAIQGMEG
jgi:NitT/TauT family transport system ATP-binding protein